MPIATESMMDNAFPAVRRLRARRNDLVQIVRLEGGAAFACAEFMTNEENPRQEMLVTSITIAGQANIRDKVEVLEHMMLHAISDVPEFVET